ncbi:MAG: universal stress protein UspA [Rhodospirillaceae bacterium]|nr:universal stress protein UspA [Rhodospirillaceae bacterium]|tara:strand:- start:43321 stop:44184 length:864 start_codon:yes stop_codon:yes gene_type:complete
MIKTILACVSSGDSGQTVLETVGRIAKRFDSHIEVLHVRADPRGLVPYTGEGMDGSMIEEIMEVTEKEGGERAVRAKEVFEKFCQSSGIPVLDAPDGQTGPSISWREESGREDEIVAIRGRLFDVVAVGRPVKDSALPSPITLEAALLDTGRPTLVAPPTLPPDTGSHVAVAWESSPEAAHAIGAAIPILERAEKVTLLAADPVEPPSIPPEEGVTRLAWSGISAEIRRFDVREDEIGAAYLKHALDANADMLIKGAYSRSRVRQMILGGRTRHIITATEIPVILCK